MPCVVMGVLCHQDLVYNLLQMQVYAVCSQGVLCHQDLVCNLLQMPLYAMCSHGGALSPEFGL